LEDYNGLHEARLKNERGEKKENARKNFDDEPYKRNSRQHQMKRTRERIVQPRNKKKRRKGETAGSRASKRGVLVSAIKEISRKSVKGPAGAVQKESPFLGMGDWAATRDPF